MSELVAALEAENAELRAAVVVLREVNEQLVARVTELERELGRHSGNSSLPPSSDSQAQRESRQQRRAREREESKAKRRPGKQPGAPGAALSRVDVPDRVVVHAPVACSCCGAGLADAVVVGCESRQVFDLPDRRAEVTEHVVERRRCGCGHDTQASFPVEAKASVCYGPAVRAVAVYLMVRHHVPVARAAQICSDLCGIAVSTGWVASLIGEAAVELEPFMTELADRLVAEPVIHVDETGARVAGAKWWVHVVSTLLLTFVRPHARRGNDATNDHNIVPRYRGVMVSDRWAPYWSYPNLVHQICCAHLLRDLESVGEVATQAPWATAMRQLLLDANRRCEAARAAGRTELDAAEHAVIVARYRAIAAAGIAANPQPTNYAGMLRKRDKLERESFNLATTFNEREAEILRFLADLRIPFTNNQAERDLRMVKLHQKISGTFRAQANAGAYMTVRSYTETGRKHGHNPIGLLHQLFQGQPWSIPTA